MSSAICLNLDQSKILSGNRLIINIEDNVGNKGNAGNQLTFYPFDLKVFYYSINRKIRSVLIPLIRCFTELKRVNKTGYPRSFT